MIESLAQRQMYRQINNKSVRIFANPGVGKGSYKIRGLTVLIKMNNIYYRMYSRIPFCVGEKRKLKYPNCFVNSEKVEQ